MNTKDTIRSLLDRLPDDCSMDDVLYHLYVVQQIELGRAGAGAGRLISRDEAAPRLCEKWVLGAAG
jgi:hypothetical protein